MRVDVNQGTAEYAQKLDERLRHQNKAKETEIENLKDVYEKKLEATRTEGEERYINALKRNDNMLVSASKDYEDKLKDYKDNLERTQKTLSTEEVALKTDHEEKMKTAKEQHASNLFEEYQNASENQAQIHSQVKNSTTTIADHARIERNRMEETTKAQLNSLAYQYNQKGLDEDRDYRSKLEADVKAHEEDVRLQKTELKKVIDKDMQQAKNLEAEKMMVQKGEMQYLENHHKDLLSQKQKDFQIRYENMAKEHETILADLKTHLDADVKKMVEQSATQKRMISSKADDQFYRVETLNPSMVESEKDYSVSLKVPEHEKENVHLSVHGREIKMTLTRRYSDSLDAEDGSSNKSTKNELYSKEFSAKEILNPKSITQKYENGVLTFKILKL